MDDTARITALCRQLSLPLTHDATGMEGLLRQTDFSADDAQRRILRHRLRSLVHTACDAWHIDLYAVAAGSEQGFSDEVIVVRNLNDGALARALHNVDPVLRYAAHRQDAVGRRAV